MGRLIIVAFMLFFFTLEAWSLYRAWTTGTIHSRGWTFQRDQNPGGFWMMVLIDIAVLVGVTVFALHVVGVIGQLPTSISFRVPGS